MTYWLINCWLEWLLLKHWHCYLSWWNFTLDWFTVVFISTHKSCNWSGSIAYSIQGCCWICWVLEMLKLLEPTSAMILVNGKTQVTAWLPETETTHTSELHPDKYSHVRLYNSHNFHTVVTIWLMKRLNYCKTAFEGFSDQMKWDYCKRVIRDRSMLYSKQKAVARKMI